MSNESIVMSVPQAAELEFAFRRNGWTAGDVKELSKGDTLAKLLPVVRGKTVITKSGSEGIIIPTARAPTPWTIDDDGNIHFTLTSNGMTCEQWAGHFKSHGFNTCDWTLNILRHTSEAPTNGVTYNVVIFPGNKWKDWDRFGSKISVVAEKRGWGKPHWEVACLIRNTFTDGQLAQMGLEYIVTMHEPINDPHKGSSGGPRLFISTRRGVGGWFSACPAGDVFPGAGGFAYTVPER